jgi:hypothetical protein
VAITTITNSFTAILSKTGLFSNAKLRKKKHISKNFQFNQIPNPHRSTKIEHEQR